jgi:hypothetical protein
VRRLAVRQARVRFSARHPREVFPAELQPYDEEMERNLGEWRRNVLYECDGLNLYTRKYQMNKKSGIMPPKPLKRIIFWSEVKEVYGVATISTSWELQYVYTRLDL